MSAPDHDHTGPKCPVTHRTFRILVDKISDQSINRCSACGRALWSDTRTVRRFDEEIATALARPDLPAGGRKLLERVKGSHQ